jgi:hypothetical protein
MSEPSTSGGIEEMRRELERMRFQHSNRLPGVPIYTGAIEESYIEFMDAYDLAATSEGLD